MLFRGLKPGLQAAIRGNRVAIRVGNPLHAELFGAELFGLWGAWERAAQSNGADMEWREEAARAAL
jgi:hypothetical protein